ncbi:MAG: type II/IV secretion system ATPase subunit [Ardenticatenaceae bacterium]|nr:type II/IV secretion system ATPase subunit [Ardenticatenaceae bacterium]
MSAQWNGRKGIGQVWQRRGRKEGSAAQAAGSDLHHAAAGGGKWEGQWEWERPFLQILQRQPQQTRPHLRHPAANGRRALPRPARQNEAGPLQPLLLDPYIEDISCSGVGAIFVEHKIFKSLQTTISFETMDQLDDFAVWLGEWIKSPVTVRNPIVDAVLPDGSRINIVYGREISKRGSNFTIRKFGGTPTSILELIEFGTLDYTMAAYLSLILEEGMNLFVVGATASGKTTTLNAINTFIFAGSKIITIEHAGGDGAAQTGFGK